MLLALWKWALASAEGSEWIALLCLFYCITVGVDVQLGSALANAAKLEISKSSRESVRSGK
jgi:hypothetical protein